MSLPRYRHEGRVHPGYIVVPAQVIGRLDFDVPTEIGGRLDERPGSTFHRSSSVVAGAGGREGRVLGRIQYEHRNGETNPKDNKIGTLVFP
jgi:hypothetical protein